MPATTIRFSTFPRTEPPPDFIPSIIDVFKSCEAEIGTERTKARIQSNTVLRKIPQGLCELGFPVESGKKKEDKIERPVFYGENAIPLLRYEVDAYQSDWRCGLEVEAVVDLVLGDGGAEGVDLPAFQRAGFEMDLGGQRRGLAGHAESVERIAEDLDRPP